MASSISLFHNFFLPWLHKGVNGSKGAAPQTHFHLSFLPILHAVSKKDLQFDEQENVVLGLV